MAATDDSAVVFDAGPIIHLDELGCSDIISDFSVIRVPQQVWQEVIRHRPHLATQVPANIQIVPLTIAPSADLAVLVDSLNLDMGERAALQLMQTEKCRMFFCDDAAARLAAESLGFTTHGTIGLIIRAMRTGRRTKAEVLQILQELPARSTLHISAKLLKTVIEQVSKA